VSGSGREREGGERIEEWMGSGWGVVLACVTSFMEITGLLGRRHVWTQVLRGAQLTAHPGVTDSPVQMARERRGGRGFGYLSRL